MSTRAWFLFCTMASIWGVSYLFIKVAVNVAPPAGVAWARTMLAATLLLVLAARRGTLSSLRGH